MLLELKRAIRRRIPGAYDRAAAVKRWLADPYERLLYRLGRKTNWRVASGPFAGMRYIRRNYRTRWAPQLIGSYEEELHPVLERISSQPIRDVINVGACDGYYAVGLSLRLPQARVIAYETDPVKREYCAEMAACNGVSDQIELRGTCGAEELASLNPDSALVICDCEGCEEDVLNPEMAPWLRTATLIVELHECYRPRVRDILTERFRNTHELVIIENGPRDPAKYSVLADEPEDSARAAILEERVTAEGVPAPTPWGIWTPRARG
jgi:hypothetical protein